MPPKEPRFWQQPHSILARVLAPLAWLYQAIGKIRKRYTTPFQSPVPVICIGNITLGGSGKTPVAIALATALKSHTTRIGFVSRGYGGKLHGPICVDPHTHTSVEVGDEPLLLARIAPTWVAKNRIEGIKAAIAAGVEVIITDDGFQNPSFAKALSLLVINGPTGFGNNQLFPAGPLREPLDTALARCQAAVFIGEDRHYIKQHIPHTTPIITAIITPPVDHHLTGKHVTAFAGIGQPEKFFETLRECGAILENTHAFPDHHAYTENELRQLAQSSNTLITTEKDWVRLPETWQKHISHLPISLTWDEKAVMDIVSKTLSF